jgi:uncharacterized protein (DUF305 family)
MQHHDHPVHDHAGHPYGMFMVNMLLGLAVMYLVMFSMIDGWGDFRNNLNMFYMALTMVAPMGIFMLATMRSMYTNRTANVAIYVGLTLLFAAGLAGTRQQAVIGDRQFIASMVPHHSGAILMCREAELSDPELMKLCEQISSSQREEIDQMNAIRSRLSARGAGA